ncbi:MAG: hypothetical protein ACE5K3_04450 [bacterium]
MEKLAAVGAFFKMMVCHFLIFPDFQLISLHLSYFFSIIGYFSAEFYNRKKGIFVNPDWKKKINNHSSLPLEDTGVGKDFGMIKPGILS